jgi:formylglycine-generating enzyme required for sulfatase activity
MKTKYPNNKKSTGRNLEKLTALFIVIAFVFQYGYFQYGQSDDEIVRQFGRAKESYLSNRYVDAKNRLERVIAVINEKSAARKEILGKCYLLLGAIFEKEEELSLAERNYRKAIDIYGVTWVEGVDLEPLRLYRQIVKGERTIEKHGKKKKFPWLLVVGGAVIVGVTVFLLLKKKSSPGDYDTKTLGIEWIDIPAGEFAMGDSFADGSSDELPVHTVTLTPYKVSKYEITFDQYDIFCEDTLRNKPNDYGWGRGTRPVVAVTWEDAKAFCDWLASKTGKNIHLPTEAQWEKAARGTDSRKYPWGNSLPTCDITNYNHCIGRTMPVGSYTTDVSVYGVYDMAGNVFEWCADWYGEDYYSSSLSSNPTGPTNGTQRVHRGGAYDTDYWHSRTCDRDYNLPSKSDADLGFRIALN